MAREVICRTSRKSALKARLRGSSRNSQTYWPRLCPDREAVRVALRSITRSFGRPAAEPELRYVAVVKISIHGLGTAVLNIGVWFWGMVIDLALEWCQRGFCCSCGAEVQCSAELVPPCSGHGAEAVG